MIIKSDYIRDRLSFIESKVKNDTKQKLYDINKTAEDIFMHLLNDVYGWQLINANDIKANFPAIDLIDTHKEIVIQVTSSMDDAKVVSTIEKFAKFSDDKYKDGAYKQYEDYDLKMFYIKEKPDKFSKATQTKIDNQSMSADDFLGIEDINTKVSANPDIAKKVFKTLCKLIHDKACESDIHKQLSLKLGKDNIIGREKELQEIDEQLKASKTLLVKGIGGVGKSTIASNYLHRHKDEYAYYGFFEGLESFESQLELAFKLEIEQGQDRLDKVLRELIKLEPESNKLLVIDKVEDIKDNREKLEKILGLEHNGYRVLLTSREEIENVEKYELDVLSMEDAKELFNSIYEVEDEVLLEEILEYLDCHAFFIDKTAHSIKKTLTPEMIRDKFKNGEFSKISVKRKESFNKFLNELFTLDGLDNEEVLMLKQLSVLPSFELLFSFLEIIFDNQNNEAFEEILNYLSEKGWLSILNEDGYKLHQIVKEYIWAIHKPSFNEIEIVLDGFNKMMSEVEDSQYSLILGKNRLFFESLLSSLELIDVENNKVAIFLTQFGYILFHSGEYERAKKLSFKSLEIENKSSDIDNKGIARNYNFLAKVYDMQGEYKSATSFYNKSLEISSKILGEESKKNILKNYNGLAGLYSTLGEYKEALSYLNKALIISKEILGEEDASTIVVYLHLALLYETVGEYDKSLEYYNINLNILKKTLGEEHHDIGIAYNNLALLYTHLEEEKKALDSYNKALNILENILEGNHPNLGNIYNNLGRFYTIYGKYNLAYPYLKKSLKMRIDLFGEEHHDTLNSYNELAVYYKSIKNYKKSKKLIFKTLKISKKIFGEEHPDTLLSYGNLAGLYHEIGELENAKKTYQKVLVRNEKVLGVYHEYTAKCYNSLAYICYSLNGKEEALIYINKAIASFTKLFSENNSFLLNAQDLKYKILQKHNIDVQEETPFLYPINNINYIGKK